MFATQNLTILPGSYLARDTPRAAIPASGACASRWSRRVDECVHRRATHPRLSWTSTDLSDRPRRTLAATIDDAFERRAEITAKNVAAALRHAIEECIELLDSGQARVAEKKDGQWIVNQWLKKAVLLYFRTHDNAVDRRRLHALLRQGAAEVRRTLAGGRRRALRSGGTRVVPPAVARRGSYIAPNTVLMPSYVNIGAYVDSGTMVDTWATVGSCAQIGKNVHLSGGVGIGGVLEPLQAAPTIIEDNCFIGARSEVVEGVIVEEGSVISMGVFIGQSTQDLRPRHRPDPAGPRARGIGGGVGQPALVRRQVLAVLRGHRQARGCADAREDFDQRAAARRLTPACCS